MEHVMFWLILENQLPVCRGPAVYVSEWKVPCGLKLWYSILSTYHSTLSKLTEEEIESQIPARKGYRNKSLDDRRI